MTNTTTFYVCPQGHGTFTAGRFCNQCGAALIQAQVPPAPEQNPGFAPPPGNPANAGFSPTIGTNPGFTPPAANGTPASNPAFGTNPAFAPPGPNATPVANPAFGTSTGAVQNPGFNPNFASNPNPNFAPAPNPNFAPNGNFAPNNGVAAPAILGRGNAAVTLCPICGGDGSRLNLSLVVCPQCRWLRPLAPGYVVHPSAFQWGADSAAMAKLRSLGPLNTAARAVSDKVGRRWVETSFNAVRLGETQLPDIYAMAIRAARLLGMPFMPDVYVSGDKMWDVATYGSDHSAFLLVGTALINNYRDDDLLFLLAREMGHCRAGHALWKTVGMFLLGQQTQHKGLMAGGILSALDINRLVEGAIDIPFLNWARQAEITADRAGMLAIGDEETARRVLLSWSLRSVPLYRQINIEAWLQQQQDSDDQMTRLAEMVSSPTPFITRRLNLLTQFAQGPELAQMRAVITSLEQANAPQATPSPVSFSTTNGSGPASPVSFGAATAVSAPPQEPAVTLDSITAAPDPNGIPLTCPQCQTSMRIPRAALAGKDVFRVRCPKAECGKILTLQKKPAAPVAV